MSNGISVSSQYIQAFLLCKTKNPRGVVVEALGAKELKHIYDFADVYHCENNSYLTSSYLAGHVQ